MARSRARARLNWVSQGQLWGRCRVRRRAERVIRPAREKNRRRRVLVVTTCSPRPVRAVQRARLCAITCIASQAALARNGPTACGSAPRRTSGLEWRSRPRHGGGGRPPAQGFPVPVGDEAVIAVRLAKRASWELGVGFTRRTMSRTGAASGSLWKGVQVVSATSAAPSIQYGMGYVQSASGMASIRFRRLLCWRMVMEKRTSSLQQTDTMLWV